MMPKTSLSAVSLATRLPRNFEKPNVVVLGAGFSKEFGYPLANELLREICNHAPQNSQMVTDLNRFCSAFYNHFNQLEQNYPNIEDFLGMLDVAGQYADIRFSKNRGYYWRTGKVAEIERGIKRLIGEYFWSFQEKSRSADLSQIDAMVEHFGHNTIYVSFNYDLLLETALSRSGVRYTYGISNDPGAVSILKPHGSINWFYKEHFKPHQSIELIEYGDQLWVANTLDFTDISRCKGMDPAIIAPTPSKKIDDELKKIWTGFSSSVHNARSLCIIGYSLANADRLTRLVLRRAGTGHSDCKKITVVRRSDCEAEYRRYISPYVKQIQSSFGAWASTLE